MPRSVMMPPAKASERAPIASHQSRIGVAAAAAAGSGVRATARATASRSACRLAISRCVASRSCSSSSRVPPAATSIVSPPSFRVVGAKLGVGAGRAHARRRAVGGSRRAVWTPRAPAPCRDTTPWRQPSSPYPAPVEASFQTLAARAEAELRERGSRFLAIAEAVSGRDEAEAFLAAQARAHRDPTHVVPAFHLHDGTAYSSDAGEPAGSAGVPLVHAIEGAGLTDVAAVVVRWYGGTNLGVGGLARAYGGALAAALAGAPRRACVRARRVRVAYAHERTAPVMRAVSTHGGRDVEYGYEADGASVTLLLPESEVE